jgi:hypothetical protein
VPAGDDRGETLGVVVDRLRGVAQVGGQVAGSAARRATAALALERARPVSACCAWPAASIAPPSAVRAPTRPLPPGGGPRSRPAGLQRLEPLVLAWVVDAGGFQLVALKRSESNSGLCGRHRQRGEAASSR